MLAENAPHRAKAESASAYLVLRKIKLLGMREISLKLFEVIPASPTCMSEPQILSECLGEPRIPQSACKHVEASKITIFLRCTIPVSMIGFTIRPCIGDPHI